MLYMVIGVKYGSFHLWALAGEPLRLWYTISSVPDLLQIDFGGYKPLCSVMIVVIAKPDTARKERLW